MLTFLNLRSTELAFTEDLGSVVVCILSYVYFHISNILNQTWPAPMNLLSCLHWYLSDSYNGAPEEKGPPCMQWLYHHLCPQCSPQSTQLSEQWKAPWFTAHLEGQLMSNFAWSHWKHHDCFNMSPQWLLSIIMPFIYTLLSAGISCVLYIAWGVYCPSEDCTGPSGRLVSKFMVIYMWSCGDTPVETGV